MAGRLRTQLKALEDLDWSAHELEEQLLSAAPDGVFSIEVTCKRMRGEPLEERIELWNQAREAIGDCIEATERLTELLECRIRRLPTYQPPPPVLLPATETTSARIESPTDGPAEA